MSIFSCSREKNHFTISVERKEPESILVILPFVSLRKDRDISLSPTMGIWK